MNPSLESNAAVPQADRRLSPSLLPSLLLPLIAALALTGCMNLAPRYERPAAPVPAQWSDTVSTQDAAGVETGWRDFIVDARLRQVVELALANNRDLRVAVQNIEVARATYRVTRADEFPTVTAGTSATRSKTSASTSSSGRSSIGTSYSAELGISSFELDLFGRLRNLSDAALQKYFSLVETQRSTQISLVAEVATAWLTLAADQQQLALAQQTYDSYKRTHELQLQAQALGGVSGLVIAESRSNLESARLSVASYQSQVKQDLNALQLLTGASVDGSLLPMDAAQWLKADPNSPTPIATQLVGVPSELSSNVLLKRPDVLAAERTLMADNANIGAARAAFFPSLSLTTSAGTASTSLGGLFGAGNGTWSFAPSISLPIFDMGSRQASLDSSRAQQAADLATYEKTIQTAFSEVADALAVRSTLDEQLSARSAQAQATRTSVQLSQSLYKQGSGSYLDVLEYQRTAYTAEQSLISLRLTEQVNRITLYKTLGGGAPKDDSATVSARSD